MASLQFNTNSFVRVRLTPLGEQILSLRHEALRKLALSNWARNLLGDVHRFQPDENGYSKFQLWELMKEFGPYIHHGMHPLPFEITILFDEKDFEGSVPR